MAKGKISAELFKQTCRFVKGATRPDHYPPTRFPEVAFIGRSNVGKSSLINAVVKRKELARTSNTPGRTQEINFFSLDDALMIVDLPGYGFAQAPTNVKDKWIDQSLAYFRTREQLLRVFILVDSRHGLKKSDLEFMSFLDVVPITYQLVLTKCDKTKQAEIDQLKTDIELRLKKHAAAFPEVLLTSAKDKIGLYEIRGVLLKLLQTCP